MKPTILFGLISLCILICCKDRAEKGNARKNLDNFKRVEIQLIDSLGTVSLFIPISYDTSFAWIHEGDCGYSCDQKKYRFQPKALPIVEENGFIPDWPTDSVESFTITHSMEFFNHPDDSAIIFFRHTYNKEDLLFRHPESKVVFDTIQKINGEYFSIIAIEKSDSIFFRKVRALTTTKRNEVFFHFDLLTRKNDSICKNFIKTSMASLKSLQINKGPKIREAAHK